MSKKGENVKNEKKKSREEGKFINFLTVESGYEGR